MLDRKALKEKAKVLFKKHYWPAVACGVFLLICTLDSFLFSNSGASTSSSTSSLFDGSQDLLSVVTSSNFFYGAVTMLFLTFFFSIFIGNPMQYGARNWFRYNGEDKGREKGKMFSGFHRSRWVKISAAILWKDLVCILWGILLIVPGVIKHYEYKFVVYILDDHPLMNVQDVMKYSKNLTNGHKMELFKLDLSFIGWLLVSAVTLDAVGIFYAGPYFYQTQALAYLEIKNQIEASRDAEAKKNYKKKRKNR